MNQNDGQWWTNTEVEYLIEHQTESNAAIAAALQRDTMAIKRKRYQLGLRRSAENRDQIARAARAAHSDVWTSEQVAILYEHGANMLVSEMKPLIDVAGPERTVAAIQLKRNALGITESSELRYRRLAAANEAASAKRRASETKHESR